MVLEKLFVAIHESETACGGSLQHGHADEGRRACDTRAFASGRGGFVRNPTTLLGSPAPQMPAFENRIPARFQQAPLVSGPMSQPAFRDLTGIGQ